MTGSRTHTVSVYAAAGVLSLVLHSLLFLPLEWNRFTTARLPAARGRTAVDMTFVRPAPLKPQAASRKPPRPPIPSTPTITALAPLSLDISMTDILEKPAPPHPAAPPRPAADDIPPILSPQVPSKRTDAGVDMAADDKGVTVPILAPDNGKPKYPKSCVEGRHRPDRSPCEGTGVFWVKVGPDGKVRDITMLESAGCPHLDTSARRWLSKARFLPATRNGKPVENTKAFDIRFFVEEYFNERR